MPNRNSRKFWSLLFLATLGLTVSAYSCLPPQPVSFTIQSDKATYLLGEVPVLTASLQNNTSASVWISPDASFNIKEVAVTRSSDGTKMPRGQLEQIFQEPSIESTTNLVELQAGEVVEFSLPYVSVDTAAGKQWMAFASGQPIDEAEYRADRLAGNPIGLKFRTFRRGPPDSPHAVFAQDTFILGPGSFSIDLVYRYDGPAGAGLDTVRNSLVSNRLLFQITQ